MSLQTLHTFDRSDVWQKDKEKKRQKRWKDKKAKRRKAKRQRTKREFYIVTSGQFRTLAIFLKIVGGWWIVGRVFTLKKSAANVNTFSHIRSSNNVTPCWKRMVKGKVLVPHWELFFRHLFHVFQMNLQAFVLPCLWAELWQAKESIESKKMGVKYYLKFCSYKNLYEILAPWRCLRSVGGPQKRSIRGKKQWQWQCIGNCNPSKLSDIKNIIITIFLIPNWKLVNKPFSSSLSKSWSWLPTSKK